MIMFSLLCLTALCLSSISSFSSLQFRLRNQKSYTDDSTSYKISHRKRNINRLRILCQANDNSDHNHKQMILQQLNNSDYSDHACSYKDLILFGIPTLGIWLLQPILSLIDTSAVGLSSATGTNIAELAAIGPGIAWIDSTAYLCQFIGMATTNLYVVALGDKDSSKAVTILSHATVLSLILGFMLTAIQLRFAQPVVSLISGTATEIIPYALEYSRFRSFGSLVAIPTIIAQSVFLTRKNVMIPLYAVLIGSVVNIIGDLFMVMRWKQGLKGAAIATTLSQFASFAYLLFIVLHSILKNVQKEELARRTQHHHQYQHEHHLHQSRSTEKVSTIRDLRTSDVSVSASEAESLKSHSHSRSRISWFSSEMRSTMASYVQLPSLGDIRKFMSFSGPLFFILLAKSFLWSFTTYACSTAGSTCIAAHQISINLYLFFVIFGDVTSQMAQTFLPSTFNKLNALNTNILSAQSQTYVSEITTTVTDSSSSNVSQEKDIQYAIMLSTIKKIVIISVLIGVVNSGVGYALQTAGAQLFTKSNEIIAAMHSIRLYFVLCVLPFALVAAMEGSLVASRDSIFHALSYVLTGAVFIAYQLYVRTHGLGLQGVWKGFAALQWWRLALFGSRVYVKFIRRS